MNGRTFKNFWRICTHRFPVLPTSCVSFHCKPLAPPPSIDPSPLHPKRLHAGQAVDPDRASPASSSSCVSPGSFYTGASESPSSPPATSGGTTSGDVGTTARDGKENQAPLSPRDDGEPPDEANDLPPTSKFFGGGGGGGGGDNGGDNATVGGKGLSLRQSGLRRRFRPPHAAPRCAASAAAASRSCSTLGRGRGSNGGGEANQDDEMGEADPWGAEYAYPRLDASRVTAGGDQRPFAAGKSGSASAAPSFGGGGRRLKRRRTLGVGSLVPSGMIRGLEGAEVRGLGGPGRRSKSLGGGWVCLHGRVGVFSFCAQAGFGHAWFASCVA